MRHRKTLRLTLVKKAFDLIQNGYKKEEYRDVSDYYNSRFIDTTYEEVVFINGYHKNARRMCLEVKEIVMDYGNPDWGGDTKFKTWVIRLGKLKWSYN